jgi:hypothetical protein
MSSNHILIVKAVLASSAAWRSKVIKTFADDERNVIAKNLLEKLATDDVPDEIIASLENYTDHEIQRETMAAAKNVGFKLFPGTLSSFVEEVIERIKGSRAEWQSAFRDGGAK